MQVKAARWFEDAMKFDEARSHHREISHHWRMFEEAVERFHQLYDGDVRAVINECVIGLGGVGPAPCVGEGVELCLAHRAARLAKQNVIIGVRIKWRIEINKINTGIRELAPVAQPFQIVAEIEAVHFPFSSGCCAWMQRSVSTGFTVAGLEFQFDANLRVFQFDGY